LVFLNFPLYVSHCNSAGTDGSILHQVPGAEQIQLNFVENRKMGTNTYCLSYRNILTMQVDGSEE